MQTSAVHEDSRIKMCLQHWQCSNNKLELLDLNGWNHGWGKWADPWSCSGSSISLACLDTAVAFPVSGWTFTSSVKSPPSLLPRASPSFLPTIKLPFLTHSLFSKLRHNSLLDFCSWNGKLCFEKTSVFDYESYPFDLNTFIDVLSLSFCIEQLWSKSSKLSGLSLWLAYWYI